ncbi:MAG: hypothetical protein RI993_2143, partial [Pseudomonadota bacterium]
SALGPSATHHNMNIADKIRVSILARLWGRALQYNYNLIIQQGNFLQMRELAFEAVIF